MIFFFIWVLHCLSVFQGANYILLICFSFIQYWISYKDLARILVLSLTLSASECLSCSGEEFHVHFVTSACPFKQHLTNCRSSFFWKKESDLWFNSQFFLLFWQQFYGRVLSRQYTANFSSSSYTRTYDGSTNYSSSCCDHCCDRQQ